VFLSQLLQQNKELRASDQINIVGTEEERRVVSLMGR
jgi:hypothetical protein